MTTASHPENHSGSIPVEELILQAEALLTEITARLRAPGAYFDLPRLTNDQATVDWAALGHRPETQQQPSQVVTAYHFPRLIQRVEKLFRQAEGLTTLFAHFAHTAFNHEPDRTELLGMPTGKTAFRKSHEYLRDTLRIPTHQARRRLSLATQLTSKLSLDSQHHTPPAQPQLADTFFDGKTSSRSAELIINAVEQVESVARQRGLSNQVQEELKQASTFLTEQAAVLDPDALKQVAQRWVQRMTFALDQDGPPPTEEPINRLKGMFYLGSNRHLHTWVFRGDQLFHEKMKVLSSAFSDPHLRLEPIREFLTQLLANHQPSDTSIETHHADSEQQPLFVEDADGNPMPANDPRTREQKILDGTMAVLDAGLSLVSNRIPAVGGFPAQIGALIDYETLREELNNAMNTGSDHQLSRFVSQALFSGPISPTNVRTLACEANILPTVFDSQGAVLDQGTGQRKFSPEQRAAVIARDRGCTAPGCSMPAPWCEIHHVIEYQHGGPTAVANAVLLCSHHHHSVHAGLWSVRMRNGVPFFTPAPHLDPDERERQNRFWK